MKKRKHWIFIPITQVPNRDKVLDSVWAMKQKRCIGTGKVQKYKAQLDAYGRQQVQGVNY